MATTKAAAQETATKEATTQLRRAAEDLFANELEALSREDDRTRPANWRLSPRAVVSYLMGGKTASGVEITPKYIGNRRLDNALSRCLSDLAQPLDAEPAAVGELVVAIPAVWFYNYLSSRIEYFNVEMDNSSSELVDYFIRKTA